MCGDQSVKIGWSFYLLLSGSSVLAAQNCQHPSVFYNGTKLQHSNKIEKAHTYVFKVDVGGGARVQYCKLICQDGSWKGPYCGHDPGDNVSIPEDIYKESCSINPGSRPELEIRFGHHVLSGSSVTRDHGDTLLVRCRDPTRSMSGVNTIQCRHGEWSHSLPSCLQTYHQEFDEFAPPRVEYQVTGSEWHVGRVGEVIVRPGAIIHLDCLQDRRRGNPSWTWSHNHKEYPTGWVVYTSQRNTHYRLSIIYAKLEDSDTFTCISQQGLTSSVRVQVTSAQCPELVTNARTNTSSTHIGSRVHLDCPTGSSLSGDHIVQCRDDASWSSGDMIPQCQLVQCPPLEVTSPHLRLLTVNTSYLGTTTFSCPLGYTLTPDIQSIWCDHTGQWSDIVPGCSMVRCQSPQPPRHGSFVMSSSDTVVGSTISTLCSDGFILIGETMIRCTESGEWSHDVPFCKRACRYPGHQTNADITPLKFSYNVGERLAVICRQGFVISGGKSYVTCTESGTWSSPLPVCLPWE